MYGIEAKIRKWLSARKETPKNGENGENENEKSAETVAVKEVKSDGGAEDDFKKSVNKINEEIGSATPQNYVEKRNYEKKSADEIKKEAESISEKETERKKEELLSETGEKEEKIKSSSAEAEKALEREKANIEKDFNDKRETASDKAIKNGVSRSSIISEIIKDLNEEKTDKLSLKEERTENILKKNSSDIEKLEKEYEAAVKELDDDKAKLIAETIKSLTEKQLKEIEEVNKYNEKAEKENAKIAATINKEAEEKIRTLKNEKLNLALSYFGTMTKAEALKILEEDKEMRSLLGDGYLPVYNYIKAKK